MLHNMMVADRIVSLGLLATGLSHHIRNSLQAVKRLWISLPKMEEEKIDMNGLRNPDFWKEYYQNVQSTDQQDQRFAFRPLLGFPVPRVQVCRQGQAP